MKQVSEITWPSEFLELKRMEDLMVCGICYDYLNTSVMTPCSHNYCSLCIRKYLHYKTECPKCFKQTYEKDLRTNRNLDQLIESYLNIRDKLAQHLIGAEIKPTDSGFTSDEKPEMTSPPVRPARQNQSSRTPKGTPEAVAPKQRHLTPKNETKVGAKSVEVKGQTNQESPREFKIQPPIVLEEISPVSRSVSSPSTSRGVQKISAFFSSPGCKPVQSLEKMVPCPVCAVDVSEKFINRHLDDCLERQAASRGEKREEPKRKPLAKLVLSLMKDAELRKRLKELGLPVQGDRRTLETRYHKYVVIYNAECDKTEPRPVAELLKQCETEELNEKKLIRMTGMGIKLQVNRNSSQNLIEEEQKKYRESNKTSFQTLVEEIKRRRNGPPDAISTSSDTTPKDEQTSIDSDDGHFVPMDDTFHDSDSSTCCPLQRYISDISVGRVNVQLSGSETNSPAKSSPAKRVAPPGGAASTPAPPADKSVYDQTTDSDSSEPDMFASPARERHKRARRSLNYPAEGAAALQRQQAQQLAESIANDFTFDEAQLTPPSDPVKEPTNQPDFEPIPAQLTPPTEPTDSPPILLETLAPQPPRKRNRSAQNADATPEAKKVLHECNNANVSQEGVAKRPRGRPRRVAKEPPPVSDSENLPKRPMRVPRSANRETQGTRARK